MSAYPSSSHSLRQLPLVTLYVTERCNSRCVTCDYWRYGRGDMSLQSVEGLLPSLARLRTQVVLLSGGEPLVNPEWVTIARLLKSNQLKVWLLTSGLALAKHARHVTELFDYVTVSLDGTNRKTYAAIRGLDAFDRVCEGIRKAAECGLAPTLRVTLQRSNYREVPGFIDLAKELGARQVSFLAADIANPHAFGRTGDFCTDVALRPEDLPVFEQVLRSLEDDYAGDFRSGFIAESLPKLLRILQYFNAHQGQGSYPAVRCNAPEFSAVIGATGRVQPCFFIPGSTDDPTGDDFVASLNGNLMMGLREAIRAGKRAECSRCVCPLWREPASFAYQHA